MLRRLRLRLCQQGVSFTASITLDQYLLKTKHPDLAWSDSQTKWLQRLPRVVTNWTSRRIQAEWTRERSGEWKRQFNDIAERVANPEPNQCILQLGWGGGWDSKTLGDHLTKNKAEFKRLVDKHRLIRKGEFKAGDRFPKTRRVFRGWEIAAGARRAWLGTADLGEDRMKAVLLANIGNSDLELDRSLLPQSDRMPRAMGEAVKSDFERYRSSIKLPLLLPALERVKAQEHCQLVDINLYLFTSNQKQALVDVDNWEKDTHPVGEAIQLYFNRVLQIPKKQIFLSAIEGNPADYANALAFHQRTLTQLGAELPADLPVYLEVSGGTPAMTAMLIVMGAEVFGDRVTTLYVDRGSSAATEVGVARSLFARKTREAMRSQLRLHAYSAAQRTLEDSGSVISRDEGQRDLIRCLLGYADRRLAFDFKRAVEELSAAHSIGEMQAQITFWVRELETGGTQKNLEEVIHSAVVKAEQGEFAELTQRLFRFQEATLHHMAEVAGVAFGNRSENLSESWLKGQTGLEAYLAKYRRARNGDMLLPEQSAIAVDVKRSLNRYSLGAIVEYFAQSGSRVEWQPVLEDIFRLSHAADLRNRGIAGHGFDGISRADLEVAYGDSIETLLEDLRSIFDSVFGQPPGESPYARLNAMVEQLLDETP